MAKKDGVRLTSKQTAALLKITDGTLRNWRVDKIGPPVHRLRPKTRRNGKGSRPRIYYLRHEVDSFKAKGAA